VKAHRGRRQEGSGSVGSCGNAGSGESAGTAPMTSQPWPEAMANVDPRAWAIIRLKERMSRSKLFERLQSPDLQSGLDPADAPHWSMNADSLQKLVI
jgi:hypothetical protein